MTEPRILAHISGDKLLQAPYQSGDDLYIQMAIDLYGFERQYCEDGAYDPSGTFKPRGRAKTGLLASMYQTSKYTLAQQMHITVDEAEAFLENFFDTYKDVKRFIEETKDFVMKNEYVETMFGRKRRFPGFRAQMNRRRSLESKSWNRMTDDERAELRELRKNTNGILRASVNAVIQGSAADTMKLILVEMHKLCKRKGWRMIATVHDQVDLLVPESITPDDIAEVEQIMTQTVKLAVPMKSDTTLGRTWGDEIPWRDWFGLNQTKEAA